MLLADENRKHTRVILPEMDVRCARYDRTPAPLGRRIKYQIQTVSMAEAAAESSQTNGVRCN